MKCVLIALACLIAGPAAASSLKGTIWASATSGPFVYTFEVDGSLKFAVTGIPNAGAAFDSVKARIGNEGGSVTRVFFSVDLTTKQVQAEIRPIPNHGPFGYTFTVDGVWNDVINGVATLVVAADAVKGAIGAQGGTFVKGTIRVETQ